MSNLSNLWVERQLLKTASHPQVGILLIRKNCKLTI